MLCFVNLFYQGWGRTELKPSAAGTFLFIFSVLASSQLEQINEERLNKTLKKLNTVRLSHPCSLIYPTRVYDCLEIKTS